MIIDVLTHDVYFLDKIEYEAGAFYIADKAYIDFERLYVIQEAETFFATRARENMNYRRLYSVKVNKSKGIKCDQTVMLNNYYSSKEYPEKMPGIKYYDNETKNELDFITSNFQLSALQIAQLYKNRWSVELSLKWIKQHLRIKTFWGYSENAVRIQIYSASIATLQFQL